MATTLQQYSLYCNNYLEITVKRMLTLRKNADILSVHENVHNGIPCPGLAISVLEDKEIKEFQKYEFLFFPLGISKTDCIDLKKYNFLGTAKDTNSSYYNVFYKIVR